MPLDDESLGWLRAWQGKRPKRAKTFVCTLKGNPLDDRYVRTMVKRLAGKALGEDRAVDVSPHTLRHSYATALLNQGFTIREAQELAEKLTALPQETRTALSELLKG